MAHHTDPAKKVGLFSRLGHAVMTALSGDEVTTPHHGASVKTRMGGWRPTGSGPNAVVQISQPELIRRSRDMRRNNPHGKRALDLIGTHTVGMGIKPRPLCSDKGVREALTELWARWTEVADADGVLDFYGLQNLAVSEMAEGGETFGRLRIRRTSDGLPVPLQIQLLPTEMVPLDYQQRNGANSVLQGIERSPIGKRVAYWIYRNHPGEWATAGLINATPSRVDASEVLHLYNVTRIGQLRGLPWLATAITTLHQVNQYVDAELLRKQMVAMLVGFIKRAAGPDVTPEELAKAWGEVQEQLGDLPGVSLEPGTMQYLEPGEDVEFSAPAEVGGSYEPFLASNYRAVAAAAGVLYEEATGDWKGSNDRTFRAQFNTFKRQARQWQFNLVGFQFNRPIWDRFVDLAVASGAVKLPAAISIEDAKRVEWRPERWEYINPKQDVETVLSEIQGGLTSRQAAVAERGDDVEVVDTQIAADKAREDSLGIKVGMTKATGPQPVQNADPNDPNQPQEGQ